MDSSRRLFLKTGIAGTALLALGGLGLSLRPGLLREPKSSLQVLSVAEYSVLAAVADRFCPGDDTFPSATTLDVAGQVDSFLATCSALTIKQVKSVLALMENAFVGLVLDGQTAPFTRLSFEAQDDILDAWRLSRVELLRGAHKALRGLVAASYYADPRVYHAVGYPGPPMYNEAPEPLEAAQP